MGRVKVFSMGTAFGGYRVIATTSQRAAAEARGVTLNSFRDYGGETGETSAVEAALAQPGVLLISRQRRDPYVPCAKHDIGRAIARHGG